MTKIEIDVSCEAPLGDFLETLEKHGGRIERFEAIGPGGGNPCLILEFSADYHAEQYLDEMGYESEELDIYRV